jgi:putative ABC transport system substrate-binding protein
MRRREFILGVAGVPVLAALPVARAQEAGRRYRIAILTSTPREILTSTPREGGVWPAVLDELGHGGIVEGGNLDVDYRGTGVAPPSLEAVAIELTRARPDVIFATGPEAARAAQQATRSISIVAIADDLVTSGLVASMAHPEGNTTGVAIFSSNSTSSGWSYCTKHFRRLGGSVFLPTTSKFRPSALSLLPPAISALRFRPLPRGPRKRSSTRSTP